MGQSAPRLKLTPRQVILSALFASGVSVAFIVMMCVLTVFPLPFGLLVVAPPNVILITACFVYISGPRWRADPLLWGEVKRQLSVFNCQVALTFIYPIYIYGFVSLTGIHQAMFVVILPVIQLIAKNWRALFIHKSARVLFITEYLVLIEYVEVVLPIVYSAHQVILYNMPNRAFYPALAEVSRAELVSSVKNVLVYSSLEFVSLILALVVLKRMLRFSTLHQLAFVLETQASMVQSKLTTLFVYVMQVPLTHLGADFTFKFAWIHTDDDQ
ncbi:hypothetical protein PC116_g9815 [Phytophthora cactorum]|uniref:Uncharacterized protein n=1 Tax=Phytophthora cactorum TaxID=29920 RepID=A0A8T1L4X7_9STRA|nr:hypothetical protein PC112_g11636 [Phytophthora cactorum]KAG2822947.1 hypothetical protein PC111_g10434 [Phytophthora cactorum]KAG2855758.1 hypothetical protein PC113_g12169 [Phytophthora cactorum]KAG2902240.1 hypothetical protein PC114_g12822 [Phytophthora cactorum]KAG2989599.1 hypothetical protein PC118_g6075 [Phytophthora cactorum]